MANKHTAIEGIYRQSSVAKRAKSVRFWRLAWPIALSLAAAILGWTLVIVFG